MNQSKELTPRQRHVFDFVRTHVESNGSAPTLNEICKEFSFKSTNAARQHLRLIAQKGYLRLLPGCARGIQLNKGSNLQHSVLLVPLLGRIAAGDPIEAIEDVEATFPVPENFWRGDSLFALRVNGDSMVDAGIFDGDIAIVNSQSVAGNGEIAAVVIGDDTTLKRFFHSEEGVRLRSENSNRADLHFDGTGSDTIRIAGVLVGILRAF